MYPKYDVTGKVGRIFTTYNCQRVNTDETKEDSRYKDHIICVLCHNFRTNYDLTCSAPQNDSLNLSFVKDAWENGKKLASNGRKAASYFSASLPPHYRMTLLTALSIFLCDLCLQEFDRF